jgi:recombinase-like zinc beta ribbon protein
LPDGATPAIVSPHDWERAQLALASNHGEATRNTTRPYLLRGVVWCMVCGQRLYTSPENVGTGHESRVYRCSSRDKPGGRCAARRVPAAPLEAWVWERIGHVLRNPEVVTREQQRLREQGPDATLTSDLETARRELAKRERAQMDYLRQHSARDDESHFPWALVEREVERLEREKVGFAATIREIEGRLAEQQMAAEQMTTLSEYCQRVAYHLETFTFDEKRLALRALAVRVVANGRDWALYGRLECPATGDGVLDTDISTLWAPLAATSIARLTCSCLRTSARSYG